jgi:hypothetical protein
MQSFCKLRYGFPLLLQKSALQPRRVVNIHHYGRFGNDRPETSLFCALFSVVPPHPQTNLSAERG